MRLDIVHWQWGTSQNPFLTVASYYPMQRQLRVIRNVSWNTPGNMVSRGLTVGWQGPLFSMRAAGGFRLSGWVDCHLRFYNLRSRPSFWVSARSKVERCC